MSAEVVKMKLSCPADVLAAVPVFLGFHPQRSLVVLGVEPRTMGARVDHPRDAAEAVAVADAVSRPLVRNQIERAIVVAYCDDWSVAPLGVGVSSAALRDAGVTVWETLLVVGDRWWRFDPESGDFNPSGGEPYDVQEHPLTAEAVVKGIRSPAASRDAVAARLVGDKDPDEAMQEARCRVAGLAEGAELRAEARWLRERVKQAVADGARVSAEDAARVLAAFTVPALAEVAMVDVCRRTAEGSVTLLTDLTRRAPLEFQGPVAAMLAFAAWQAGDGAFSRCAVDVALAASPDSALAKLVSVALDQAMDPSGWEPFTEAEVRLLAR